MTAYSPDPRDLTGRVPRANDSGAELAGRARYSRWDGSQRLSDLDADEILGAISDDVMAEGDLGEALRRLMERGWRSGDPTRPDMAASHSASGAPLAMSSGLPTAGVSCD